jgi:hypothetical protein
MANQFLIKNTMADMRDLSASEITALHGTTPTYAGLELLGYYEKGDTPEPIRYYLSNSSRPDDGGSTIEVGGIKLEHRFNKDEVYLMYFPDSSQGYLNFFNYCGLNRKIAVIHKDITIEVFALTSVRCPRGLTSTNNNYIHIKGQFFFNLDELEDELLISDINFSTEGLNAVMANNNVPRSIFDISTIWKESVNFLSITNVNYKGMPLDLTGATRSRGFINIKNVQNVVLHNLNAKHIDVCFTLRNCYNLNIDTLYFENVGTGIYGNDIYNATITNCTLRNTVEQANNWRGKTAGYDLNGKDLIFATGSDIIYTNNKSYNPIERNCYFIADNVTIKNCYSLNGDGFKAVGDVLTKSYKNVEIAHNLLEVDDHLAEMPLKSIVLLHCYFINKGSYQNNRIRILSSISEKTRTVRGMASISRTNGELNFNENYSDYSHSGMIMGVQKTADDVLLFGEKLADKLVISNNYTYTESTATGALLAIQGITGGVSDLNYFDNLEMYSNSVKLPVSNDSVNIIAPLSIYNIKGATNVKAKDNKIIEGRIRYTSGIDSSMAGTAVNATLVEKDLTCVDLNSNMIAIRNLIYNKGTVLKFIQVEGKGTLTHYFNDSIKTFGESGMTVIEKSDNTNSNFNIQDREVIIEGNVKGTGYFKSSLVHGINIFEPIFGILNTNLIKYASNQIQINGSDVGKPYWVKATVI